MVCIVICNIKYELLCHIRMVTLMSLTYRSQLENNKVEVESQQDVTLDRESFLEDDKHIN